MSTSRAKNKHWKAARGYFSGLQVRRHHSIIRIRSEIACYHSPRFLNPLRIGAGLGAEHVA
jgi:hypothetical protein